MQLIEFVLNLKDKYVYKDFSDDKVINDINFDICNYLLDRKKGDLYVQIYKEKYNGQTLTNIAKNNSVSIDVVRNCLSRIRTMVEYLENAGIKLEKFSNFKERKYTYSKETIEKINEKRSTKYKNK